MSGHSGVALTQVHIDGIRNLRNVKLRGLQRINVFFGTNGSGKTSVLESIHVLGMARSFRSTSIRTLITHGEDTCTVYGAVQLPGLASALSLGVQRQRTGWAQLKIGGRTARSVAELASQLPLQVITAESFGLLTGPPVGRRQYLDWGVFHVEHRFFAQWQRFQRCIKQRNMLLRRGKLSGQELAVWTRDLAQSGSAITDFREAYFSQLTPRFKSVMAELAPSLDGLELQFRRGWDSELSYGQALERGVATDLEQGYTHVGPQRADVRVTWDGHAAADTLSRGQQKLVVCGLKLAQGQLLREAGGGECVYLIDDLPSELDERHSRRVCEVLAAMESQVFITCVDREDLAALWPDSAALGVFHVEHGEVQPV